MRGQMPIRVHSVFLAHDMVTPSSIVTGALHVTLPDVNGGVHDPEITIFVVPPFTYCDMNDNGFDVHETHVVS
jgi:hypothetical protein